MWSKVILVVWCSLISHLIGVESAFKCGKSDNILRIVGGTEAKRLAYPWQVLLQVEYRTTVPNQLAISKCGASLIDDQWVVTAAHCFDAPPGTTGVNQIRLTLGEHDTDKLEGTEVFAKARTVIVHGGYEKVQNNDDIAMVKLDMRLDLNGKHSYLQPICLPIKGVAVDGAKCHGSGWGLTSTNGPDSHILRHVTLPLLDDATCKSIWRQLITPNKICAGVLAGGVDTCQGDSGGPLSCPLASGVWVLEGVTSFGAECAKRGSAGVYTKVENYLDWIANNKAKNP